ncbi:MAG: hypothetical protein JO297_06255 [Nitrososphaeraceae archaeon]|nr:hypothetical protein [Nitrososphaeraceae archaeon]
MIVSKTSLISATLIAGGNGSRSESYNCHFGIGIDNTINLSNLGNNSQMSLWLAATVVVLRDDKHTSKEAAKTKLVIQVAVFKT